jgi:hypothetical protein
MPAQRTEFRRAARNLDEYEQMTFMFVDLYPDVLVPKSAWQWVEPVGPNRQMRNPF